MVRKVTKTNTAEPQAQDAADAAYDKARIANNELQRLK